MAQSGRRRPAVFPQRKASVYQAVFTVSTAFSVPGNNFWNGTSIFTDPNSHLTGTTTVNIPYNIAGAEVTIHNGTDATTNKSLSFVGPDGGTPIVVGAGKTAILYCTATWVGSSTMHGTWLRKTADA